MDFKKQFSSFYNPPKKLVEILEVPTFSFLMVDGKGDPNQSAEYQQALEALFTFSYTLKFMVKKSPAIFNYSVMPLEGLWWVTPPDVFSLTNKTIWHWTAMVMQPPFIDATQVEEARKKSQAKKDLPLLAKIRFEKYSEGLAAQTLHIGPYSAEQPTIDRLHQEIERQGYKKTGKHHEIYLNDPNRTAADKIKVIIRQPVIKA